MAHKKHRHPMNTHHIVARSVGGSENDKNKIYMDMRRHEGLHILLANRLPHQQINELLWINKTALTNRFKDKVQDILNKDQDYIYERGVFKRKY